MTYNTKAILTTFVNKNKTSDKKIKLDNAYTLNILSNEDDVDAADAQLVDDDEDVDDGRGDVGEGTQAARAVA